MDSKLNPLQKKYKVNADIASSLRDNDTLVLINLAEEDNCYFQVKGIASKVFLALEQSKSVADIKAQIMSDFEVEEQQLEHDICQFLDFLVKQKIIFES
jgi:hypothetical protein